MTSTPPDRTVLGLGTVRATADVTAPRLTFAPFAGSAQGLFERDRVAVTASGTERQRVDPRAACAAVPREAPWDDLHLLYFTGYAMWNYLCTPFFFTWPGFAVEEIGPGSAVRGVSLRGEERSAARRCRTKITVLGGKCQISGRILPKRRSWLGRLVTTRLSEAFGTPLPTGAKGCATAVAAGNSS